MTLTVKACFKKFLLSAVAAICIHVILKLNIGDLRLLYGMFFLKLKKNAKNSNVHSIVHKRHIVFIKT